MNDLNGLVHGCFALGWLMSHKSSFFNTLRDFANLPTAATHPNSNHQVGSVPSKSSSDTNPFFCELHLQTSVDLLLCNQIGLMSSNSLCDANARFVVIA